MAPAVEIPGYEIIRPLGSGGMSTVYLALQRSLDRKVAIKIMRRSADPADTRQLEKRFLLEGRMMAKLPHRNIVAVYDIVSNDELAYIAMEYLSGGSLTERMRSGLALSDAVSVIVQIAGALDYAHTQNVVHRDLKPANIMFRDGGTPVLTDFGIARYQDSGATKLTQTGMLVGTPTYMSPEQINAETSDGRSDLYSLGILFYELLTGAAPFKGESPIAVLMAHLTQPPPPLPPELAAFQDILDRMLAKKREDRFADMKEFSATLKSRLVQSDTLQIRLQVDPNQSTSEQLRALGFASTPGDGLRASLPTPRETKRPTPLPKVAAKAGTANAPPAPPAVPAPAAAAPNRRRWMIGGAVAVLLLGIVFAILSLQHGRLSRDEQELVALWIKQANALLAENHLVTPADESAYAYVQKVQQKDPKNEQAQALLDQIVTALTSQAEAALAAGKFDEALDAAKQGLLVRADNPALTSLKAKIESAQKANQVKADVAALLAGAQRAEAEHKLFGADGAFTLLGQAHALAPDDGAVNQRVEAFVADQLAAPRKALQAGQLAAAQESVAKLEPHLAGDARFVAFKAELDAALKQQQAEKQLADLVARGTRELRENRLDAPAGNNAYETWGELGKLGSNDKRVADFGAALAKAFADDARRLDAKGDAQSALNRATTALQIEPQLGDAQQIKARIEQRLGQRAAQIAQALGAVRQAIAEQRFTPPAPNDAHTALAALRKLDPENADAKQLEAELPKRIADAVTARAASDAAGAAAMLKAAQQVYPQDPALTPVAAKLDAQLAGERQAAQVQAARTAIAKTVAAHPKAAEEWRKAAQALAGLPEDKETAALRGEVVAGLGEQLRAATTAAEFDALAKVLGDDDKVLRADPGFAGLKASEGELRAKIAEAEQARLAAQVGELVLNAYPWATVESVLDANRKPVPLPPNPTTPLVLSLAAGNYVVTFRHPQVDKTAQVIAKVEAKKRVSANATFPTISAQDYFTRAGWQP